MTPYLICYAWLLGCLCIGIWWKKVRLAAFAAFAPMFYLIAARGLVGVDSAFYLQQFDAIRYRGVLSGGFEPGFSFLVYLLTFYFPDSFDILILLGCVAAILLLVAGLKLERRPLLFLSLVVPFFLFDMTMNGLRYGLAFAIVALGAVALINGRNARFLACLVVASLIQVSSIALAVGAWALIEARLKIFTAITAIAALVIFIFGDYLFDKAAQNADLGAAGGFAGVLPLVITMATLIAVLSDRQVSKDLLFPSLAIAFLQIASFIFSRYYYAGLRLQSIVVFMMYLVIAVLLKRKNHSIVSTRVSVFLIGVAALSSGLRIKNFYDESSVGISPFVPYYFATEVVN